MMTKPPCGRERPRRAETRPARTLDLHEIAGDEERDDGVAALAVAGHAEHHELAEQHRAVRERQREADRQVGAQLRAVPPACTGRRCMRESAVRGSVRHAGPSPCQVSVRQRAPPLAATLKGPERHSRRQVSRSCRDALPAGACSSALPGLQWDFSKHKGATAARHARLRPLGLRARPQVPDSASRASTTKLQQICEHRSQVTLATCLLRRMLHHTAEPPQPRACMPPTLLVIGRG